MPSYSKPSMYIYVLNVPKSRTLHLKSYLKFLKSEIKKIVIVTSKSCKALLSIMLKIGTSGKLFVVVTIS